MNRTKTGLERSLSTGFDTCEVVSTGVVLKIVALLVGVLEAVFLIGLGASIPAMIGSGATSGNRWFVLASSSGSPVHRMVVSALRRIVLVIVGGLAAIWGLTLTIQAGLVFGAAPLVSGFLFVWAGSRSAVADDLVRGAHGTSAT